jgi:hypothetical protein
MGPVPLAQRQSKNAVQRKTILDCSVKRRTMNDRGQSARKNIFDA